MFNIYIANLGKYVEGYGVGDWISLPATEEEFDDLYDRIQICHDDKMYYNDCGCPYEEIAIHDYDTDLGIEISEYESISYLNDIAEQTESLNDYQRKELRAILEANSDNLQEALDILNNDDYIYYDGVSSYKEIAEQYVDEVYPLTCKENENCIFRKYFDYDAYARDYIEPDWFLTKDGAIELLN